MNDRKIEIHVWEVNVGPVRTSDSGRNKPEKQTANANDTLGYFMYQMYSVHCTQYIVLTSRALLSKAVSAF